MRRLVGFYLMTTQDTGQDQFLRITWYLRSWVTWFCLRYGWVTWFTWYVVGSRNFASPDMWIQELSWTGGWYWWCVALDQLWWDTQLFKMFQWKISWHFAQLLRFFTLQKLDDTFFCCCQFQLLPQAEEKFTLHFQSLSYRQASAMPVDQPGAKLMLKILHL